MTTQTLPEQITQLEQAKQLATSPAIALQAGSTADAMAEANAQTSRLWMVPRAQIRVLDGFNVRVKSTALDEHIRSLANSMLQAGFDQQHPLAGYVAREGAADVIYVTDGHCRLQALDLAVSEGAAIERVPMIVSDQARSMEEITVALARSATGKPLEALEKAAVCKRLIGFGWSEQQVASRLSLTATYVRDLLTLIGAPAPLRDLVAQDKISATAALHVIAEHGDAATERIQEGLQKAQKSGKTRVTAKFIAPAVQQVTVKQGVRLYSLAQELRADPGFASLSEDMQKKLDDLLQQIASKKERKGNAGKSEDGASAHDADKGGEPANDQAISNPGGKDTNPEATPPASKPATQSQPYERPIGESPFDDEPGITREPFTEAA